MFNKQELQVLYALISQVSVQGQDVDNVFILKQKIRTHVNRLDAEEAANTQKQNRAQKRAAKKAAKAPAPAPTPAAAAPTPAEQTQLVPPSTLPPVVPIDPVDVDVDDGNDDYN